MVVFVVLGKLSNFKQFYKNINGPLLYFSQIRKFAKKTFQNGPAFVVREKIIKGKMKSDYKQTAVVEGLQKLYENIDSYTPGKLLVTKAPKGLYIYGSVGSGKTTLMDIFYETAKTQSKRRSHFNNFMTDVHSRIHDLKKSQKSSSNIWNDKQAPLDAIKPVAKQLVKEAWLLCFDEFQVTDIADAMILKRLFTEMFENGMVMVATSNRSPDDLYKNGLQRSHFLPFIPVLKKYCDIVAISGKDYRTELSNISEEKYLITGERKTKLEMDAMFKKLCYIENKKVGPKTLNVLGHQVMFRNTCGGILFTSFKELCEKPLASADYIQIAKHFDIILIKDVPKMDFGSRNQARRFVLLIDTLYDYKVTMTQVRVMMSAATTPNDLFSDFSKKKINEDEKRMIMDDLNIEKGSENEKASLFSGLEEVFAFERTVSRITEMCSSSYWKRYEK